MVAGALAGAVAATTVVLVVVGSGAVGGGMVRGAAVGTGIAGSKTVGGRTVGEVGEVGEAAEVGEVTEIGEVGEVAKVGEVASAGAAGSAGGGSAAGGGRAAGEPGNAGTDGARRSELRTVARFSPPMAFVPSRAVTYDMSLVPAGARIEVEQRSGAPGTTVLLHVSGVRPGHSFGADVHTEPCGADPAAAGGRYRNRVAPVPVPVPGPVPASAGPAQLGVRNEVRLDFTADAHGSGAAQARQAWGFRSGQAGSVVIHGKPGAEGDRVACFTVPFQTAGKG